MVSNYHTNTCVCVPPIKNSTTEFTSTVKLVQMLLKAPKKFLSKKEGKANPGCDGYIFSPA